MPSRRKLLLVCLEALAFAALPYGIILDAGTPRPAPRTAAAKEGNGNGGGNSGGNGSGSGGKGGGNGNGNGGNGGGNGSGGNGSGNGGKGGGAGNGAGGNGGSQGGSAKGNARSGAAPKGSAQKVSPDAAESTPLGRLNVERRHRNGVSERLANGRYEMHDARGRTIISRRATEADRKRFRMRTE